MKKISDDNETIDPTDIVQMDYKARDCKLAFELLGQCMSGKSMNHKLCNQSIDLMLKWY